MFCLLYNVQCRRTYLLDREVLLMPGGHHFGYLIVLTFWYIEVIFADGAQIYKQTRKEVGDIYLNTSEDLRL